MFTSERREYARNRVVEMAKADARVTGGALTGSKAGGAEDRWSDIDVAFGIVDGTDIKVVLADWTEALGREFGVIHYWDLPAGSWIYRVFLMPDGLELDLAVAPEREYGARGPTFHLLFGEALKSLPASQADARNIIGLGWHHVLHARSSIERGKPWRAEYWISGVRDEALALACLRLGENGFHARSIDNLPASVTGPMEEALVRSLDEAELRRALAAATSCFLKELEAWDAPLFAGLKPVLEEFAAIQRESD
jgi:hypothetical protein